MIGFVNAKINIGLDVVARRADGYHDLSTLFYPIGLKAGTPENPTAFGDILEVVGNDCGELRFRQCGTEIDCRAEDNLVYRAAMLMLEECGCTDRGIDIILDKHLPFGAGLGGGSADAAFTLRLLNDMLGAGKSREELAALALRLGADCPFFIYNEPSYAEGVGERLEPVNLNLGGRTLLVVMPVIRVSTRDAFAGIRPASPEFPLRDISCLPVAEWRGVVKNDFETTLFPKYPSLADIKESLYRGGAEYASLSGSGSALYGIFSSREAAMECAAIMRGKSTVEQTYLLSL